MKKVLFLLFSLLLYGVAFTSPVSAQNKVGINIGDHHEDFIKAADIVGSGGWVVVMACPGDGDKIAKMIVERPNVNLVIRGHYPGQTPDANWAKLWAATLSSIPSSNKIYFVPWNEPNQVGWGDYGDPAKVVQYVNDLTKELGSLLNNKVLLLSPMMNISNPSFSGYVDRLGSGFFQQFYGIALSLYDYGEDDCGQPLCGPSLYRNAAKSNEILVEMNASGMPVFGVESGTAGKNFYYLTNPTQNSPLYCFVDSFLKNNNVRMFAIPSYDLGGEVGHTWSLFEPMDVANLLKNSPKGGTTLARTVSIDIPLIKCPGKNYSFYLTSESECGGCGSGQSGEPYILSLKDSLVCSDFDIKYYTEQTISITPSPNNPYLGTSAENRSVSADFRLNKVSIPDFSQMYADVGSALTMLLPEELRQKLSVEEKELKTDVKNFVNGKEIESPVSDPSKNIITWPSWWSGLIGRTKILCGLFGTCEAPKSVVIKIEPSTSTNFSITTGCQAGYLVKGLPVQIETPKSSFSTTSRWTTTVSEITDPGQNLTQQKTVVESWFTNKTRGAVPGGETFGMETSTYADTFLPAAIAPGSKNTAVACSAEYMAQSDYSPQGGADKLDYQNLAAAQARWCLQLCAIYPKDFDVSQIDSLCPSCNAKDYPVLGIAGDNP